MKRFFVVIYMLFIGVLTSTTAASDINLDAWFCDYTGAMVIMDAGTGETIRYNPERCAEREPPCSTFKIPNAVFGLDSGVLSGADHVIPWDGTKRFYDVWNQDLNLGQAIQYSSVPYFQNVARGLGQERMQDYLDKINYGNKDMSAGIDIFWLGRSLRISPDEQVVFLRKLFSSSFDLNRNAMNTVSGLLLRKETAKGSFYGKTGSCNSKTEGKEIGWFVGFVDTLETRYYFALNITDGQDPCGKVAELIAFKILVEMGFLGDDDLKPSIDPGFTRLKNGIYKVHEERTDANRFDPIPDGTRLVTYDQSTVTGYPGIPVRYVVLDREAGVPMKLREKPEKTMHANGNPMLLLKLEKQYVEQLEKFTGDNVNKTIATVIDGKIITMHKVRTAITGGLIQITRCNDTACEVIYSKLME